MKKAPLFTGILLIMVLTGALLVLLPDREYSELENRMLAGMPQAASVLGAGFDEAMEAYACDHFPARDQLVAARTALLTLLGERRMENTLVGRDGWLFEIPPAEATRNAVLSMETLDEACQQLKIPMSIVLIETSSHLLRDKLPSLAQVGDQRAVIETLYGMTERMETLYTQFDPVKAPELYYRTDHHLTAQGAWHLYESICASWGMNPLDAPVFEAEGFRGSYYSRVPSPFVQPETMSVCMPEGIRVTIDNQMRERLIDHEKLSGRNKYAAILSETYGHIRLDNATGEGSLMLLCDSYANAVAPLLAQHFARIDMVDPRYFTGDLASLCGEAGTQRILVLMGLNTFSANRGLLLMDMGDEE